MINTHKCDTNLHVQASASLQEVEAAQKVQEAQEVQRAQRAQEAQEVQEVQEVQEDDEEKKSEVISFQCDILWKYTRESRCKAAHKALLVMITNTCSLLH